MRPKTLGEYLLDCLKQEGLTDIFGVPGDYNFSLLDAIERYAGLRFINGRNELNSGYAADAYARIRGLSALITTFGVGEMSACNAVMRRLQRACARDPYRRLAAGCGTEAAQADASYVNGRQL